jgi:hypothetical protein
VDSAGFFVGGVFGFLGWVLAFVVGTKRLADIAIQVDLHGTNVSRTAV